MIINKRFYKALTLALLISTLMPIGVSARVIADTTTQNGITIEMSKDGYLGLTSTNTGGKILYYTKSGETVDKLSVETYPKDMPVKFYDSTGKLTSTRTDLGGKPMYSDSDYSNWNILGYTVEAPKGSDFDKAEGFKVMQSNKKVTNADEWFVAYEPASKGYVEVVAVYQYSNGTYSSPVSKVFSYDKDAIKKGSIPSLTITDRAKDANSQSFTLDCKAGENQTNLVNLVVSAPYNQQQTIQINALTKQIDYTAKYNGKYTFTLTTVDGQSTQVVKDVTGLTFNYTPLEGNSSSSYGYKQPVVTFSELPTQVLNGASVLLHISTDIPCTLNFNGKTYENKKDFDVEITDNGSYAFHLIGINGASTDSSIDVNCFPDTGSSEMNITSYWNKGKKSDNYDGNKLPQTGGLALATVLGLGVTATGFGFYLTRRKKKTSN